MQKFYGLVVYCIIVMLSFSCSQNTIFKDDKSKISNSRNRDNRKKVPRKVNYVKRYLAADIIKINIDHEVVVPFCKSNIEIWFKNTTMKGDTCEGKFRFTTNKNAFIKSMQLEINGIWEKDMTFYRTTGDAIYSELTDQDGITIDPAILQKNSENDYFLRVFPVTGNEIRKVRLELYSILETKDSLDLRWTFKNTYNPGLIIDQAYFELNLKHNNMKNYKTSLQQDTLFKNFNMDYDFTED